MVRDEMSLRWWFGLVAIMGLLMVTSCDDEETSGPSSTTSGGGGSGGEGGTSSPDPTIDGGIISTSADSLREAESTLVVADDGRVAVAWIARESSSMSHIGYRFSTDWGESWEPVGRLDGPTGGPCADPVLAMAPDGTIVLVWLEFAPTSSDTDHIYVARAPAGSTTFEAGVEVTDPNDPTFYDKPNISVTGTGAILVTFTRQVGLVAARSADGLTWERTSIVNEPPTRNHIVAGCSAPGTDRVWVTHLHYDDISTTRQIMLRRSDDGGASWPASNAIMVTDVDELDAGVDDPSCVADGDNVWVLYGRTHDTPSASGFGTLYAVVVAHSSDGGQTIDGRYQVQDPNVALQLHPRFARTAGGGLALVYYGGMMDNDAAGTVRYSYSADTMTFAPSLVMHEPVTFLQSRGSNKWIGEYFGVGWHDDNLYTAYIDNAGNESHVAFYRTALPQPNL